MQSDERIHKTISLKQNTKKTILITGGAGFIGSNFVKYIYNKYPNWHILVLDALTYAGNPENIPLEIRESSRFEFWYGSVTQPAIVNKLVPRSDIIVHFAAETHVARSIYDNSKFFETDVIGTQIMMNAAEEHQNLERFIHISTSEVYGTAVTDPMDETHPLDPTSPYAAAKCGADRLVYSYMQTYKYIPALIIRPFNNYGPNQHLEKLIPRLITNALQDKNLRIYGDGLNSRDWIFVEDTCEAIDTAIQADIEKVKGQIFNIGTGSDISVEDVAEIILKNLGKPETLITKIPERPGEVRRHISCTKKAEKILNFKAKTNFKEGIQKTINWYKINNSWWKKLEWMKEVPIKLRDGQVIMY